MVVLSQIERTVAYEYKIKSGQGQRKVYKKHYVSGR